VTRLRKRRLEELQRLDYSQSTARIYLHVISDFARHFGRSPDTLGPEHIRQYQLHLFHKKFPSLGLLYEPQQVAAALEVKKIGIVWGGDAPDVRKNFNQLRELKVPCAYAGLFLRTTLPGRSYPFSRSASAEYWEWSSSPRARCWRMGIQFRVSGLHRLQLFHTVGRSRHS
jgi:hypothetical protein